MRVGIVAFVIVCIIILFLFPPVIGYITLVSPPVLEYQPLPFSLPYVVLLPLIFPFSFPILPLRLIYIIIISLLLPMIALPVEKLQLHVIH